MVGLQGVLTAAERHLVKSLPTDLSGIFSKPRIVDTQLELPFHGPAIKHRNDEHRHDLDRHAAETWNCHRHHDVAAATGGRKHRNQGK